MSLKSTAYYVRSTLGVLESATSINETWILDKLKTDEAIPLEIG